MVWSEIILALSTCVIIRSLDGNWLLCPTVLKLASWVVLPRRQCDHLLQRIVLSASSGFGNQPAVGALLITTCTGRPNSAKRHVYFGPSVVLCSNDR